MRLTISPQVRYISSALVDRWVELLMTSGVHLKILTRGTVLPNPPSDIACCADGYGPLP